MKKLFNIFKELKLIFKANENPKETNEPTRRSADQAAPRALETPGAPESRENPDDILKKIKDPALRDSGFNLLVKAYQQRLYWHIRKMVIDHDDADDLLQEVFIKVWKNIDKFREDSNLFTWL